MADAIPIENVYYLLCYAWDQLEEGETIDIQQGDCHNLTQLFARVLSNGTQRLVKRGFDRGYILHSEETARLRGRLDMTASMARQSWQQGKMVCEFDELSHNVLHNRILKTTISVLQHAKGLSQDDRHRLQKQADILRDIPPVHITGTLFRRVHLHRNNRFYKFLLNVCELIHHSLLPTEQDGSNRFRDFIRDEKRMPYLFERFVRNFYKQHSQFTVGNIQLRWDHSGGQPIKDILPIMQTDVSLKSAERSIILDCKFYKEAMSGWHGQDKLHANNLYQLYSYLRNARHKPGWENSEGILLYPATGEVFDYSFQLDGHPIRVTSVNLDRPWQEIHETLLERIDKHPMKELPN